MAGKWDGVVQKLEAAPVENKDYQYRIDRVKESVLGVSIVALALAIRGGSALERKAHEEAIALRKDLDAPINSDVNPATLVELYHALRLEEDRLDLLAKDVSLWIESVTQLMVAEFNRAKIKSMKNENGVAATLMYEPYPQIVDKEAFRLYCIEQGMADQMYLHPSTAASMIKDMLEEQESRMASTIPAFIPTTTEGQQEVNAAPEYELPPGVKVFKKTKFRLTGK